ncbi:MAG: GntR family transcriptional regulator, partial [Paracoccaceae bacterium]
MPSCDGAPLGSGINIGYTGLSPVIMREGRLMSATYKDVKSDILAKITRGEWPPGSLLPNEIDLAQSYGCARATVNRAMR